MLGIWAFSQPSSLKAERRRYRLCEGGSFHRAAERGADTTVPSIDCYMS